MDEEVNAVLSDVESEDSIPITADANVSVDKYRELLGQLDQERKLREVAEASKSEIQASFHKIKALAHEAIKKRDQALKERDEIIKERDEVRRERDDALRVVSEMEEGKKQLADAVGERDEYRSEMEKTKNMLVGGIDKISGKVTRFKNFDVASGLPRSQKYSGLPATAYGVIKRTNEIVEEMIKQVDTASKAKNEVSERMDHRNYEIAIEVSQLEATISGLRDDLAKKDKMIETMEQEAAMKSKTDQEEAQRLKDQIKEYNAKLATLESGMESHMGLLVDQLSLVGKIHNRLYTLIKFLDANHSDSEVSESLFLPQKMSVEENVLASLAGMESIYELIRVVADKTRDMLEERTRTICNLQETVNHSIKEKENVSFLLRSALSTRLMNSEKNELLQNNLQDEDNDICSLASEVEKIVKALQSEIMELRQSVGELRVESLFLKEQNERHTKELNNKLRRIQELEEKEKVSNENIEGLMMDITTLEEEIQRWKAAAEQEAAAGGAVEQELSAHMSNAKLELEEMRQALLESEKKVKFKEQTAIAAIAARETAEKSLALADARAARLRERLEVLNRQLEEIETQRETSRRNGHRYVCWPWQWLGMDFVGNSKLISSHESPSNEMELSEPLI